MIVTLSSAIKMANKPEFKVKVDSSSDKDHYLPCECTEVSLPVGLLPVLTSSVDTKATC